MKNYYSWKKNKSIFLEERAPEWTFYAILIIIVSVLGCLLITN